jgi:hypothetical protein
MRRAGPKHSQKLDQEATNHERQTFLLANAMEEPLARAVSYVGALELIGYGLCRIGDEHGQSVIALAEVMSADLGAVQKSWRQMVGSPARRRDNRRTKA